jgi:ribosomal protein L34E
MKEVNDEGFYPTRESFPTNCDNCNVSIATEMYRGKGLSSEEMPHGHKDPRHTFGAYCSVDCSKEDGGSGTIFGEE